MTDLGELVNVKGQAFPQSLTDYLLRTACVFVVWVGTAGPVGQVAAISCAVKAEASVIRKTIVSCSATSLMAKGIVAARDELLIQL